MARYGERDYDLTQNIGAALAFLGLDGLIAPSARWSCDNLMIYQTNHHERLEFIEDEQVDWQAWMRISIGATSKRLKTSAASGRPRRRAKP